MSKKWVGDGLEVGGGLPRMDSRVGASRNDRAAGQPAPGGRAHASASHYGRPQPHPLPRCLERHGNC